MEKQPPRHFTLKSRFIVRQNSKSDFFKMERDIEKQFSACSKEILCCEIELCLKPGTQLVETLKKSVKKTSPHFEKLFLFEILL